MHATGFCSYSHNVPAVVYRCRLDAMQLRSVGWCYGDTSLWDCIQNMIIYFNMGILMPWRFAASMAIS